MYYGVNSTLLKNRLFSRNVIVQKKFRKGFEKTRYALCRRPLLFQTLTFGRSNRQSSGTKLNKWRE